MVPALVHAQTLANEGTEEHVAVSVGITSSCVCVCVGVRHGFAIKGCKAVFSGGLACRSCSAKPAEMLSLDGHDLSSLPTRHVGMEQ